MKKLLSALSILLAVLTSCSKPSEADITILYTTDVHGMVLPFDFMNNKPAAVSLANVCTCINEVRAKEKNVILLDAGDIANGQPSTYYYNNVDKNSEHIIGRAVNYLGYDAVGIGDNDLQFGEKIYKDRMPQWFKCPMVCANAINTKAGETLYHPYTIIEKGGIKIAVFGLTEGDSEKNLTATTIENLTFTSLVAASKLWIPRIQNEEKPDVIIGLIHDNPEWCKKLVETVAGFDVILMGRNHEAIEEVVKDPNGKDVYMLEALTHAAEVGQVKIHLTSKADGTYTKKIETSRLDMSKYGPDMDYTQQFEPEIERINNYLDEPIANTDSIIDPSKGLVGPSEAIDLIHEMQLWITGAEISVTNFPSNLNLIEAGPFTMRDLFNLYRYDNQIWTVEMSGAKLKDFLEKRYDGQFNTMKAAENDLIAYRYDSLGHIAMSYFGPELKTSQYTWTSAAGINYTVDVSKPNGEKVQIFGLEDGQPFDTLAVYRVAINDHLAVSAGIQKPLTASNNDIRMNFSTYLQMKVNISPRLRGNWNVIPEDWWQAAAERDREFLKENL